MFILWKASQLTKRRPAVLTKESGNLVSNALGTCEDQDLVVLVAHDCLEVLGHAVALLKLCADLDNLLNAVVSGQVHGTNVHLDPVLLVVSRQLANLLGPCSGPHAGLSVGANLSDDLADLRLETHVKHAVSLVENKVCNAAKVGLSSLKHVDKTSRSGDAHLDTASKVADLGTLGNTSVDAGVSDAGRLSELADFLLNLDSKLTSRCENKNNRAVAGGEERLSVDVDNGRKTVGECLSGTSLGDTNNVATRESHGPSLSLNSGGLCETLCLDFVHDIRREASLVEGCDGLGDVLALDGHLVLFAVLGDLCSRASSDCGILLVEGLLKLGHRVEV